MANTSEIESALAREVGVSLPPSYGPFLDGLPHRPRIFKSDAAPILSYQGRQWRPYTRERLREPVQYNRDTPRPRAHEMMAVAEELRAGDTEFNGEMSAVLVEQGFTLERLARGFCVGDDGNGEPVFVDADTGAVFVYYHDGMDVEQWADSLTAFIDGSETWTGDEDVEPGAPDDGA